MKGQFSLLRRESVAGIVHLACISLASYGRDGWATVQESDTRNVRRGLEQDLFNRHWGDVDIKTAQAKGSLNGQRPMSTRNPALGLRAKLVENFRAKCL